MKRRLVLRRLGIVLGVLLLAGLPVRGDEPIDRGSANRPLRVMLVPSEGGTSDGTIADFQPLFDALTRATGLAFELRVGSSYGAVVEAMAADLTDIAWFGVVTYTQARERGVAELLAVATAHGRRAATPRPERQSPLRCGAPTLLWACGTSRRGRSRTPVRRRSRGGRPRRRSAREWRARGRPRLAP